MYTSEEEVKKKRPGANPRRRKGISLLFNGKAPRYGRGHGQATRQRESVGDCLNNAIEAASRRRELLDTVFGKR